MVYKATQQLGGVYIYITCLFCYGHQNPLLVAVCREKGKIKYTIIIIIVMHITH